MHVISTMEAWGIGIYIVPMIEDKGEESYTISYNTPRTRTRI